MTRVQLSAQSIGPVRAARRGQTTTYDSPWRVRIRHARNSLDRLDYELPREWANVADTPKGKATPQATGNRIRTGNGTKKSLVKLEPPERENAKAKNLESETARPASTGNRTRKSLIESETQDSKTKKHEGKRPEGPGETGPKEASVP
ncbi:protein of unknown function [Streptomyces sp. KY75]|nr:protein of unknown function [Streptomyces sp. KY75]CAD5988001.1 protein of unknown function [Streptomyces sp. KY70]